MNFDVVKTKVSHASYTKNDRAKILYDFVMNEKISNILELGFSHGASSCYMAAALEEKILHGQIDKGYITSIDNQDAVGLKPNINDLLKETNLKSIVNPIFAHRTYTWELMKILEANEKNPESALTFDFCFIDGHHSWEVDGFAFLLVDKLLKPGSWILFDDMFWSFASMPADHKFVIELSEEERNTAQIAKVFELLVKKHSNYSNFHINDGWGWAQKISESSNANTAENAVANIYAQQSIYIDILSILRKIKRKFF